MRSHFLLGAGLIGAAAASLAGSQTFSIDAHVFSAGTSVQSTNSCYRLEAVIGEPVAAYSQSASYSVNAGFLNATSAASDSLFATSFEDCTP